MARFRENTSEKAPEKSVLKICKITDLRYLPKSYTRSENKQYHLYKNNQIYVFFRNGRAGVFSRKTGKIEQMTGGRELVRKLQEIDRQKLETQKRLNELKMQIRSKKNQTSTNKEDNNDEIFDNDTLLFELKSLIGGSQKKINAHLNKHADQYKSFVNSIGFQESFDRAIQNPKQNALIIQLYARFKLGDNNLVVDGKYGDKTKNIVEKAEEESQKDLDAEKSKEREARREEEKSKEGEPTTKNQAITYKTSEIVANSISEHDDYIYSRIFRLPDETVEALIKPKEKKRHNAERLEKTKEKRQKTLYEKAKKSAIKGCINYLQRLFKQNIQVENKQEELRKLFDNLDMNNGIASHGESIDFKVVLNGRQLSLCYDISTGDLRYDPLFMIDPAKGDVLVDKEGREGILISGGQMPSLGTMLAAAKTNVISQASQKPGSWEVIKDAIKHIEKSKINLATNQEIIAKTIAKESCMKTFLDITGYKLSQDLPRQSTQNTQIYAIYDMMNRTFNNPNMKAGDIYKLKYLLDKFTPILQAYQNPSNTIPKNVWSKQITTNKLHEDQNNLIGAKLGDNIDKSLSFYTLFNQYVDDCQNPMEYSYHTLNLHKIEAGLNYFTSHGCLEDKSLVSSIEHAEKASADLDLDRELSSI